MNNHCEARRRQPDRTERPGQRYVLALDAVDFHVNALRYRAGLSHSLNAEEQQLVRRAGELVTDLLRDDDGDAGWAEIWLGRHTEPAFMQAVAIELQWRGDALAFADALTEG